MRNLTLITTCILLLANLSNCTSNQKPVENDRIEKIPLTEKPDFTNYFSEDIKLDGFESCGYGDYENTQKHFPLSIVEKYDLAILDIDKDFEVVLKSQKDKAKFFPIAKKKVGNTYVLLYGITFNNTIKYATEYRIILYQDEQIIKNLLFSANVTEDGENSLCRILNIYTDYIELTISDAANISYLKLKDVEKYYFDTNSNSSNVSETPSEILVLPVEITYKTRSHGKHPTPINQDEINIIENLGMSVSNNAFISTLGTFNIHGNVSGKLRRVVEGYNTATILSTWDKDKLVNRLLVQKYVKGEPGYSSDIIELMKISRAEMFEIGEGANKRLEVDHFDEFIIKENGEIIKVN